AGRLTRIHFDVLRILKTCKPALFLDSGKRFERTPDSIRGIKRLERLERTDMPKARLFFQRTVSGGWGLPFRRTSCTLCRSLASILGRNQLAGFRINAKRSARFDKAAFCILTGHLEVASHLSRAWDGPQPT